MKRKQVAKRKPVGQYSDPYETVSDEDIRKHGAEAAKHLGLAGVLYSRTAIRQFMTRDEWNSEAFFLLVRCLRNFDPDSGVRFSTYAMRALRSAVQRLIFISVKRGRQTPTDPFVMSESFKRQDNIADWMQDESSSSRVAAWMTDLANHNPRWALVVRWHVLDGITLHDIGERTGVTIQAVVSMVKNALRWLRMTVRRTEAA